MTIYADFHALVNTFIIHALCIYADFHALVNTFIIHALCIYADFHALVNTFIIHALCIYVCMLLTMKTQQNIQFLLCILHAYSL